MPIKQSSTGRPSARELRRAYGGKTRSEAIERALRRFDDVSREISKAVLRHLKNEVGHDLSAIAALEYYIQEMEVDNDV